MMATGFLGYNHSQKWSKFNSQNQNISSFNTKIKIDKVKVEIKKLWKLVTIEPPADAINLLLFKLKGLVKSKFCSLSASSEFECKTLITFK